jgi:two-component system response regulator HydG
MARILLVDDEPSILSVLEAYLGNASMETISATSAKEALKLFAANEVDLMVVDLRLGEGMDGIGLMHECRAQKHDLPVIMITAYGTIEVAVQAMKEGAFDFITKPFEFKGLLDTIEAALAVSRKSGEEGPLPDIAGVKLHFGSIIGESAEMHKVYSMVKRVAPGEATVLILGESGTGKELVAQAIHKNSKRANGPWVPLNCAAMPANLLESEMFGHAAGSFTGATGARHGLFKEADHGTLFLDEVGVMDMALQGKLLRALQEGKVRPVGENKDIDVNVRVIAATNERLENRMEAGEFREDLYYRISVIPIELPPLRHRQDDILLLAEYFAWQQSRALEREITWADSARNAIRNYSWPGNVRELQNAVACAATLSEDGVIKLADLPPNITGEKIVPKGGLPPAMGVEIGKSLRDFLREKEQQYMELVLERTGGNRAKAADLLGISRATFYRKFPEVAGNGE